MESSVPPTLSQRLEARSRSNSRLASLVIAGLCVFLGLKWWFFPTPEGGGVWGPTYIEAYGTMTVFSLGMAVWAQRRYHHWLPMVLAVGVLAFGMTLTWIDVHMGDDYTGYTISIFALGVFFSAVPSVYALLLGTSFLVLTGLIAVTFPGHFYWSEVSTRLVIVALAFIGCTLLEKQRRTADALMVQLEELNAQLRESSIRDVLTGLYNRRFLLEFLESRRSLSLRMGIPLSVVLIDLDHFKLVNDRFGHPAGDSVLKEFAQVLLAGIRESDLAARFGGEEFLLVLPQADEENASRVTNRILEAVGARVFDLVPGPVTFSAGVAHLADRESVDSLLSRVDKRLYAAKKTRNTVVWTD